MKRIMFFAAFIMLFSVAGFSQQVITTAMTIEARTPVVVVRMQTEWVLDNDYTYLSSASQGVYTNTQRTLFNNVVIPSGRTVKQTIVHVKFYNENDEWIGGCDGSFEGLKDIFQYGEIRRNEYVRKIVAPLIKGDGKP